MFSKISIAKYLSFLITLSLFISLLPQAVSHGADAPPELDKYVLNNSWGGEANVLNNPTDVAVGVDGRIYVLNAGLNRITVITPDEEIFNNFGSFGFEEGQLVNPSGIAIDKVGNVYVIGSWRVQKFTADGDFVKAWGHFSYASGIAVDDDYVYIADESEHRIHKFTLDGNFVLSWGSEGSSVGEFNRPSGLAVDLGGHVYVADTWNHRIQKFSATGEFEGVWGSEGSADGDFIWPYHLSIGSTGEIFVSDWGNYRVQVFSDTFEFVTKWELFGSEEPHFRSPRGMDFDAEGNLLIAVGGIGRVQKYSSAYEFVTQWGITPKAQGQFSWPMDIAVDADGNIFVADTENRRIQKFNPFGVFLTGWDILYEGINWPWPISIAVDSHGFVYVLDQYYSKVQKFDPDGNLVVGWALQDGIIAVDQDFPTGIAVDKNSYIYITGGYNNRVHKFNAGDGTFIDQWGGEGYIDYPVDVAVDHAGNVYVIDRNNFLIRKFRSDGTPITAWGEQGNGEGSFSEPIAIAVDTYGYVYILDSSNRNIQVFTPEGEFISCWNTYLLYPEEQLNSPRGIALDAQGKIYITDTFNQRIQVIAPALPDEDPLSGLILNGSFNSPGRDSAFSAGGTTLVMQTDDMQSTNGRTVEGLDYWAYGGVLPIDRTDIAFNGDFSLQLGAPMPPGEQGLGTAWASQVFYIPKANSPELSFNFNVFTNDSIERADFIVEIQDAVALNNLKIVAREGYQPSVLGKRPDSTKELGWKTVTYDLAPFRGRFVRLVFSNRNLTPNSHGIWTFVEQVSVRDNVQKLYLPLILQ